MDGETTLAQLNAIIVDTCIIFFVACLCMICQVAMAAFKVAAAAELYNGAIRHSVDPKK
jgi:hypothetical protein